MAETNLFCSCKYQYPQRQHSKHALFPLRVTVKRSDWPAYRIRSVTWCSSWRRRWSWDSSCLLCSSSMCMRASRRPLCCRNSLASANRSASSGWLKEVSDSHWPPGGAPRWPCCSCSCSYSLWRFLGNQNMKEHVTPPERSKNELKHSFLLFSTNGLLCPPYLCSSSRRAMIRSSSPRSSLSTAWRICAGLCGWLQGELSPPRVWQYWRMRVCSSSLWGWREQRWAMSPNILQTSGQWRMEAFVTI